MDREPSLPRFLAEMQPDFLRGVFFAALGVALFLAGCACGKLEYGLDHGQRIRALEKDVRALQK